MCRNGYHCVSVLQLGRGLSSMSTGSPVLGRLTTSFTRTQRSSHHTVRPSFQRGSLVLTASERYVRTIVNRYKDSPNVFAWELMNEARCLGDLRAGPNCPAAGLLTRWYKQQSDFVRSLWVYIPISENSIHSFHLFQRPIPPHHDWWRRSLLVEKQGCWLLVQRYLGLGL